MDPMQRLDRAIKVLIAVITLAALALIGMRVVAGKTLRVDPKRDCEAAGRQYDASRNLCLPR